MEVQEITSDQLEDDGDRWTTPRLWIENKDQLKAKYLDKDINTLSSSSPELAVPVFWAEPDREKSMDNLWSLLSGSVKFKVVEGRRRGFVGYFCFL